jgi:hypothetical protein
MVEDDDEFEDPDSAIDFNQGVDADVLSLAGDYGIW